MAGTRGVEKGKTGRPELLIAEYENEVQRERQKRKKAKQTKSDLTGPATGPPTGNYKRQWAPCCKSRTSLRTCVGTGERTSRAGKGNENLGGA